jgi:(p)ppGpp synthase/HD superfamily hydrolase
MTRMSLREVAALAIRAHASQVDKAGKPYLRHLAAVARSVTEHGGTEEQIAAAWLHDAIEDGVLPREWLDEAPLAPETKEIVLAVTKQPGESPEKYAARILETPGALLVKQADLAHNADPERLAVLDRATRERLTAKYARMYGLLGLA